MSVGVGKRGRVSVHVRVDESRLCLCHGTDTDTCTAVCAGQCLMTSSPAPVPPDALRSYHISVTK